MGLNCEYMGVRRELDTEEIKNMVLILSLAPPLSHSISSLKAKNQTL